MKLRNKVISMNMVIILSIMCIGGFIVLKAVDNFNLYTVYQYLLGQSNFSQQYLLEYFRVKSDPGTAIESSRDILEERLASQAGCNVKITGVNIDKPTDLQKSALEGNKTYLISTEGPGRMFYLSFPVFANNSIIGTVSYEYSLYQTDMMRKTLIITIIVLFLIALLVSLVLSCLFSYRMIKPLERLTDATKEFAKGNFRKIEEIRTGDEIEGLAHSFSEMGSNIQNMIVELKNEQEKQKEFLDNVTHEIRTPLTNILGYTDLLDRVGDEERKRKCISNINGEGNRLLNMVNNLLELSRLNRYELAVNKRESDIKALLEQTVNLMADRAHKYGFRIVSSLEQVTAQVDEENIKQVVINLIDNAVKYSEGDIITIRLWKEDRIYICVSDNGKGIPEKEVENIMEPFYRVDKSRSRKLGGSGLGLSICKDIIKVHGGEMKIESRENSGTTVTVSLQP